MLMKTYKQTHDEYVYHHGWVHKAPGNFYIDMEDTNPHPRLKKIVESNKYEASAFNIDVKKNSFGFRSDEFKKDHQGKHILFAGCSNTWGSGLELHETWHHFVLEELKKEELISGYYNVAINGGSIQFEIIQIFKYMKVFGNPDVIFFNMPNVIRSVGLNKFGVLQTTQFFDKDDDNDRYKNSIEFNNYMNIQMYSMLEMYCLSNNIKLISFSWSYDTDKFNKFDSFHEILDTRKQKAYAMLYPIDQVRPIHIKARDRTHQGIIFQSHCASTALKAYYNDDVERFFGMDQSS